jgi:hypothetical protein
MDQPKKVIDLKHFIEELKKVIATQESATTTDSPSQVG